MDILVTDTAHCLNVARIADQFALLFSVKEPVYAPVVETSIDSSAACEVDLSVNKIENPLPGVIVPE